jgi:hypothetical protein
LNILVILITADIMTSAMEMSDLNVGILRRNLTGG